MAAIDPYLDTSALAKRYVQESGSDEVDRFLGGCQRVLISRLAVVEFRCLLKRRLRAREIDATYERAALDDFGDDVRRGHFQVEPMHDRHALIAYDLIDREQAGALRTLDALHLAIAQDLKVALLATADQAMARAARELGIATRLFGPDAEPGSIGGRSG